MTDRVLTGTHLSPTLPLLLIENDGLVFSGERIWPGARLTPSQAEALAAAKNPTGRSNSDVLRAVAKSERGQVIEEIHVDFPLHYTEQEASLYRRPFSHLRRKGSPTTRTWWLKPAANLELRTAVARLERCLIAPLPATTPEWRWLESHILPSADFLVVARDDDFSHGVLASACFKTWWRTFAAKLTPVDRIRAFPFPWSPGTALSSLTREQEEQRLSVARASRNGDEESLNAAVAAAYGWNSDIDEASVQVALRELNQTRSHPRAYH